MTVQPPPPPPPGYFPPQYYGPPPYDVGAAFSWSWGKLKAHLRTLVGATFLLLVAIAVAYAIAIGAVFAIVPHPTLSITNSETGELEHVGRYFATLGVLYGVGFVLAIPISVVGAGLTRIGLLIADGGRPGVGELFKVPRPGRIMVTSLLVSLGTIVGLVVCYLPGIAFGLFATFSLLFVLDRDLSATEAIKASFSTVKGRFGATLGMVLLAGLAGAGGFLLCIVGGLFTVPLAMLVHVYTHRFFTGGQIAT